MLKAILFAHEEIKKIVAFIDGKSAPKSARKRPKCRWYVTGDDVKAAVREYAYDKCCWVFETYDRHERQEREAQVKAETAPNILPSSSKAGMDEVGRCAVLPQQGNHAQEDPRKGHSPRWTQA